MLKLHDLQGERKDQLLIVADKNGRPSGTATREVCHKGGGKTHLAFAAFISDDERKTLLTRRSRKKSLWGGCWDAAVVSHVLPGETVEAAAKRRGGEELGIEVNFKRIGSFYYFAKHKENSENEYCYVLIGKTNDEVYPNPVEIMDLKKINLKELLSDIKKNPHSYTPWLKIAIRKINISRF